MKSANVARCFRSLATTPSRRGVARALTGSALAGALSPLLGVLHGFATVILPAVGLPIAVEARKKRNKRKKKIKRNSFGCVNVGNHCKRSEQCCSGICQGKKDKKKCQAHDTGGCHADEDVCVTPGPICNTSGICLRTTGQASYCGNSISCVDCQKDTDCQAMIGPSAACIVCAQCPGNTGCVGSAA